MRVAGTLLKHAVVQLLITAALRWVRGAASKKGSQEGCSPSKVAGDSRTAAQAQTTGDVAVDNDDVVLTDPMAVKDRLLLRLQAMLTSSQDPNVQQQAARTLGRLAADPSFAQSIAEMPAAVEALVALLCSSRADVQEAAIVPLAWMAYWLPSSRASMVGPCLVDGLLQALGSCSSSTTEAQALAAGAVADLAHELCVTCCSYTSSISFTKAWRRF